MTETNDHPANAYIDSLSSPLQALPEGLVGKSSNTAGLPEVYFMETENPPTRLSDAPGMMQDLADNFREFVQPYEMTMNEDVRSCLRCCFDQWTVADRNRLIGGGANKRELHIQNLHSLTIMNAIPLIFQDVISQHPGCEMLRAREVSISTLIGDETIASGLVDRCFTLEIPDEPQPTFKCCWFDDKNLAVLRMHEGEIENHIQEGKALPWEVKTRPSLKLLLKVSCSNTIKRGTGFTHHGLQGAYYTNKLRLQYGMFSTWERSILLRQVVPGEDEGEPYLACSSMSEAGEGSSANVILSILSIIFEKCASLGLVEYPILPPPALAPLVSVLDETEYLTETEDDDSSESGSGSGSGSSFRPPTSKGDDSSSGGGGSSSSGYGSPDAKGKRVTRSSGQGGQSSKRQRKGNAEPVRLSYKNRSPQLTKNAVHVAVVLFGQPNGEAV